MSVTHLLSHDGTWPKPKPNKDKKLMIYFIIFVCPLVTFVVLCLNNYYSYYIYSYFPFNGKLTLKFDSVTLVEYGFNNIDFTLDTVSKDENLGKPPLADAEMCTSASSRKVDCFPRGEISKDSCAVRGCCFSTVKENPSEPTCFYPSSYQSYIMANITKGDNVIEGRMKAVFESPYPKTAGDVYFLIKFISDKMFSIQLGANKTLLKESKKHFQMPSMYGMDTLYTVNLVNTTNATGFQVIRKSNNKLLFDSSAVGGFLFANQFVQISTTLPKGYIYGLGGGMNEFPLDTFWKTRTLFTHDTVPSNKNGYTYFPLYTFLEEDGKSHSVNFVSYSAVDFVLQPNILTYRGIYHDLMLVFTIGESPIDAVASNIMFGATLPPYWALGFHLSRFGYKSLQDVIAIWSQMKAAGIPYDTQWLDIDYMKDRNDFTIGEKFAELSSFAKILHNDNRQLVLILDPGVSASEPPGSYPPYDRGMQLDIFIKDSSGSKPIVGKVWNKNSTVFPDFFHPKCPQYWSEMLKDLHNKVPFDGIWLDMNEPSNFVNGSITGCTNNSWDNPPYEPTVDGSLNYRTVCMSALHYNNMPHYLVHNYYGFLEAIVTYKSLIDLTKKRPFIISRSFTTGASMVAGHWTGDISSTWEDMSQSVKDLLNHAMFGVPMVGADICGFNGNTTVDLCRRWSQLGAFYPFSRNHNTDDGIPQDPVSLNIINSTKEALLLRYSLMPYLYTIMWEAVQFRMPVIRPSFFMFPDVQATYNISSQFFLGESLLVVPVLTKDFTYVDAYVGNYVWYELTSNMKIGATGAKIVLPAPEDKIPVLLLGGRVIPMQKPGLTTYKTKNNPMFLKVAMNENEQAVGNIYLDDGETLDKRFSNVDWYANPGKLESIVEFDDYKTDIILERIEIFAIKNVVNVTLNNKSCKFIYNTTTKVLTLPELRIPILQNFTVNWS